MSREVVRVFSEKSKSLQKVAQMLPESCPKVVSELLQTGFKVAGIQKWRQNGFRTSQTTKSGAGALRQPPLLLFVIF